MIATDSRAWGGFGSEQRAYKSVWETSSHLWYTCPLNECEVCG